MGRVCVPRVCSRPSCWFRKPGRATGPFHAGCSVSKHHPKGTSPPTPHGPQHPTAQTPSAGDTQNLSPRRPPPPRLRQPHLENCVSEGRPLGGPGDPPASWGSPSAVGLMSGLYSGVWGHCRAQTAPTEPASLRAGRLRWVLTPGRCGARTRCSMSPR